MTEVKFLPPVAKYLKKLKDKKLKEVFRQAVDAILANPMLGEEKHGDLCGIRSYDIRYKKTDYELAYRAVFENEKVIIVIMVGSRENFYEELKRYLR